MKRRTFLSGCFPALIRARSGSAADRPNVLWVLGDDLGPQLGCYGYPLVRTPNMDRLAQQGVRFTRAHTTGPVCSASRSGFNTGLYQTSIGCQVAFTPRIMDRLYGWLPLSQANPQVYWVIHEFLLKNVVKPPPLAIAYLIAFRPKGLTGVDTRAH